MKFPAFNKSADFQTYLPEIPRSGAEVGNGTDPHPAALVHHVLLSLLLLLQINIIIYTTKYALLKFSELFFAIIFINVDSFFVRLIFSFLIHFLSVSFFISDLIFFEIIFHLLFFIFSPTATD